MRVKRDRRKRRLLAARELPATLAALVLACIVEVGLRVMPLPRLARLLGTPLTLKAEDPLSTAVGSRVGLPTPARQKVLVTRRVLRRWPFGDTCLRQALVSGYLLRRMHPRLHLGVARRAGKVRAHAWLVIDGRILDPLDAFGAYLPLGAAAAGDAK